MFVSYEDCGDRAGQVQVVGSTPSRVDFSRDEASEEADEALLGGSAWERAHCRVLSSQVGARPVVELFFSEHLDDIAGAKSICAGCPVIGPCLEGALERGEPWGVWGGQLLVNGKVLAQKRKRGRPPKHEREPRSA